MKLGLGLSLVTTGGIGRPVFLTLDDGTFLTLDDDATFLTL